MRAALIDGSGKIENIIELPDNYDPNGPNAYLPPEGLTVQKDPKAEARVGGSFNNGVWTNPPEEIVDILEPTTQEQLDALVTKLEEKGTLTSAEVSDVKRPSPVRPNTIDPRLGRLEEE